MSKRNSKMLMATAFGAIAAIALARVLAQARKDPPDHDDEEQTATAKTPSRVIERNGETFIRLTPAEQARAGIETITLRAARERRVIAAPGVVLDATSLVNLATGYAAAQAGLSKAENDLSVSRLEYERLKALYADQQNVSAKAFQAAQGVFRNDQTSLAMARRNLEYQMAALRQSWGDTIAQWVASGNAQLERILNRQDTLIQVTLPPDGPQRAPGEIPIELPGGQRVPAKLLSRFPRVDPRIQGASFLYVTRTEGPLEPGLNVIADVSAGPRIEGVVIPLSAVVWLNGEAWVYVETAANEFTRRAVEESFSVAGGLFVSKGFKPGERIVSAGAQMLLSEEFRSQSGGGEEEDKD
jgi:membrane fusion protein, multidrug efflux system